MLKLMRTKKYKENLEEARNKGYNDGMGEIILRENAILVNAVLRNVEIIAEPSARIKNCTIEAVCKSLPLI